ncbi:MAG: DNA primase small subunit domain-containing protein [Candidatus Diapherotrites archaeon]
MNKEKILQNLIAEYYKSTYIDSIPEIEKREFGKGELGKKITNRHLAFKNSQEFNNFLREKAPFYVSYSAALYEKPEAKPMEAKKIIGSDLVFEFDADDFITECKQNHDSWECPNCKANGKGLLRECPECGSGTITNEWVCENCLTEVKKETQKLLELLKNDFGFNEGITINYSGHKGFHVHVRAKEIKKLSKSARTELTDYITGTNLEIKALGFDLQQKEKKETYYKCPKKSQAKGWQKKILEGIQETLEQTNEEELAEIARKGMPKKRPIETAKKILEKKQEIIENMENGKLINLQGTKGNFFWQEIIKNAITKKTIKIDRQTSIDINKIIRVPETIHGETGLIAKTIDQEKLKDFDPLKECVVLPENEIKVQNAIAPKFMLKGKKFGPYNNEEVILPTYAAFIVMAKQKSEKNDNNL